MADGTRTATDPATADELSVLASKVTDDVSDLVRAEIALAKAELRSEARSLITGSGLAIAGTVGLLIALLALVWAAAWGLAEVLPTGASFAIVGGALLLAALLAVAGGVARIRKLELLPRTRQVTRRSHG